VVVNKSLWHNPRVSTGSRIPAPWASSALRLTCVIAVLVAGCYWLRYHDLVETHCELLEDLSVATLAQVEALPPRIAPGDVERLRYPLQRAREFIRIAEQRHAGSASLAELTGLVGAYEALLDAVERLRVGMTDAAPIPPLVADVRARAERVRAAVRSEKY
jgi:hypothetical protein